MGMISSPLVGIKQMTYGGKKRKAYDRLSAEARANQEKISGQLKDWGDQDWENWQSTFAPAEEAAVDRAKTGFSAQTERATGNAATDNAIALKGASGALNANLSRRGVNPASGSALAARSGLSSAGAAKAGTDINMARTNEENRVNDLNWNNRLNMVGVGSRGLSNQALMLTKASDVINVGARRAAGLSDMYSNAATAGLAGVGEGIGRGAEAYGNYSRQNSQAAGGDWDFNSTDQYGNTYGNRTDDDFFDNQNSMFNARDGGVVRRHYAEGGLIVGPGNGISDSVPAKIDGEAPAAVSNGEYHIKAEDVARIGLDKLKALVAKYHTPAAIQEGA